MYDVIIIGGGAAGLTAAIYSVRYKLKTAVIAKEMGGVIVNTHEIENWPGEKSISGLDLMNKFEEQAKSLGVETKEEEVKKIKKGFKVITDKAEYETKTIILAMGTKRRKLNIPGEDKLAGKGVSYCATCDAAFFKDKTVAVVGGNDSAARAVQICAEYSKKVYVIYRKEKMRAEPALVEELENNDKVEFIYNANVTEVSGDKFVEKIKLDTGKNIELQGLFIEVGGTPAAALAADIGVKLNDKNYIEVSNEMKTSCDGVYAAGDITTGSAGFQQLVTASSEGAIAAFNAYKFIKAQ